MRILHSLSEIDINPETKVVVVSVATYVDPKIIDSVLREYDAEVCNRKRPGGMLRQFLGSTIPTNLVFKIKKIKYINDIIEKIDSHIIFEIYIFDRKIEHNVVSEIRENQFEFPKSIQRDEEYFMYGADLDNGESSTEIMEKLAYGIVPKSLSLYF